ncbi:hypothetical protein [Staphylococcus xylosus]|uniref:hypothetical protein n=1 Tax=Staphylococcus xylosus TaxID=1288 RepID=UPI003F57F4DC
MAYEYECKLLDYASGSKTYEEYKAMTQELKEVYRKAKAWDLLKVELKRELDMESERLRRANRNLEDDDSKEYIIGKITGQNVELMNIMTTISDLECADDER